MAEQAWAQAQRRHRLSAAQVRMARELGLNPKKLGKIDNHRQEPWKTPLPEFIEDLYARRFGRRSPGRQAEAHILQAVSQTADNEAGAPPPSSRVRNVDGSVAPRAGS